jgi:hypothetical protein
MYNPNSERLSTIAKLRAERRTIDEIAAITGYPRSTVGYYVAKYCGGRTGAGKRLDQVSSQAETPKVIHMVEPDLHMDRVDEYLRNLEKKESLTIMEVLDGKQRGSPNQEAVVLHMFERHPETLKLRLDLVEKLIRLAPFLRLNLDRMRDMITLCLAKDNS